MLKIESYRKGILLSSVFNIFAKGLVFLNSLVIAYFAGTQIKMDIYFFCYNTIAIISTFIASANSSVIIPEFMRVRIRNTSRDAENFLNIFIYGYLFLTTLLCLAFYIDPVSVFTTFSKYQEDVLKENRNILYLSPPLLLLISLTTLLTDALASYRYFTVPVIVSIINSLISLTFLLFFYRILDINSLLIGMLFSYSLNIIILLVLMKRKLNWSFAISNPRLSRKVFSNLAYSQTGNFLTSLGSYAPLYFLSGTVGGVIAALNYAQQIVTQANSVITYQISVVSRIKLSELYAQRKYKKINEVFVSTVKFLVFITIPISGFIFVYAEEIIILLFRRGSFNDNSVVTSSLLLRYLALSLPFTSIISIAGNLYVAAQLIKVSIIYQVLSNVLLIIMIYVFVTLNGFIGYPLAYLLINVVNVLVVQIYCKLFFPFIQYSRILRYVVVLLFFNAAIVFLLYQISSFTREFGVIPTLFAGGCIYGAIVLLAGLKWKINDDFNHIISKMTNKLTLLNKH